MGLPPWLQGAMDLDVGVSQNEGYLLGGPHNKDYSILGSILGSPYLGKLPCVQLALYVFACPYQLTPQLQFLNPKP